MGKTSLVDDLKKLIPVWLIVFGSATGLILTLEWSGKRYLEESLFGSRENCAVAGIYESRAIANLRRLEVKVLESRIALTGERGQFGFLTEDARNVLNTLEGNQQAQKIIEDLERAIELCPQRRQGFLELGFAYLYVGKLPEAMYSYGQFLISKGEIDTAIVAFQRGLEEDAGNPRLLEGLLSALYRNRQYQRALQLYDSNQETIAATNPGKVAAGRLLNWAGRHSEAETYLAQALTSNIHLEEGIRAYEDAMLAQNKRRQLADNLVTWNEDRNRNAFSLHLAAIHYRHLEDFIAEESAIQKALTVFPNSAAIHFDHAVSLWRLERYAEARNSLNRALSLNFQFVMDQIDSSGIDPRVPPN